MMLSEALPSVQFHHATFSILFILLVLQITGEPSQRFRPAVGVSENPQICLSSGRKLLAERSEPYALEGQDRSRLGGLQQNLSHAQFDHIFDGEEHATARRAGNTQTVPGGVRTCISGRTPSEQKIEAEAVSIRKCAWAAQR